VGRPSGSLPTIKIMYNLNFSNSNCVEIWENNLTLQTSKEVWNGCLKAVSDLQERQFLEKTMEKVRKVFALTKNRQYSFEEKVNMLTDIVTEIGKSKYNYNIPDWYFFENSVDSYYSAERIKNNPLYIIGNIIDLEREQKGTLYYGIIIIVERLIKTIYYAMQKS